MKLFLLLLFLTPIPVMCQEPNYCGVYSLDKNDGFELVLLPKCFSITLYNPSFVIHGKNQPGSDIISIGPIPNYKGLYSIRNDSILLFTEEKQFVMKLFVIDSLTLKVVENYTKANCIGDSIFRFLAYSVHPNTWPILWNFSRNEPFAFGSIRDNNWHFFDTLGKETIIPDTNYWHPYSRRFYKKK